MAELEGKVAVITGGASGIGEASVRLFVEEGAKVVIADMQRERGESLAAALGDAAVFVACEVRQEDQVKATVDAAVAKWGRLDCMFNNAGFGGALGLYEEIPAEDFDMTFDVLVKGVFLGMKHAARVMVPQKSGSILSLSSTAGVIGGLGPHAYTAAKHGVVGLTKSVSSELAGHGIRVNAVAPGNTVTAMTSSAITGDPDAEDEAAATIKEGSPLGIAGFPIDIANALLYLASEEARYISGHTLVVDGGGTTDGAPAAFHEVEADILREDGKRGL